jgi:pimeloyl-ACP methyl ester carboxylesterase
MLKKTALSFAVFIGAALTFGFVVQLRRDAEFRHSRPPPGSFVKVDGRRIHFRLHGAGDFTFVLETGLGDYSGSWDPLEPALTGLGRVFSYDRAGLGWSDESPYPRTARQIAVELHAVLEAAHVPKPYILVGHSLGGICQTLYATLYPNEVAGLLLIDPATEDQFKKLPRPSALVAWVFPQISRAAAFGIPQFLFTSSDPVQNLTSHVRTTGAELRAAMSMATTQGDGLLDLGDIPITVLTAGDYRTMPGQSDSEKKTAWDMWRSLHEELLTESSSKIRSHKIVVGATHYIYRDQPAAVIDAARELVDNIVAAAPSRAGGKQPGPR